MGEGVWSKNRIRCKGTVGATGAGIFEIVGGESSGLLSLSMLGDELDGELDGQSVQAGRWDATTFKIPGRHQVESRVE